MSAAAEWADISPFPRGAANHESATAGSSVTNLSWSQQRESADAAAPLFGARRQWLGYVYETTGYGSIELSGATAYRVTLVHPDDDEVLQRHHRSVRRGRVGPGLRRARHDASHLHVLDRDELQRTDANTPGSWLFDVQRIARLCGSDDEVARIAGASLRRLLWFGREHLDSEHVVAALAELACAAEALADERVTYRAAVERWIRADPRSTAGREARLHSVAELTRADVESIQLEVRVLAEVRHDVDGEAPRAS